MLKVLLSGLALTGSVAAFTQPVPPDPSTRTDPVPAQASPGPDRARLAWLERRGLELATRVRIEQAGREFLERQGVKTRKLSSPVVLQDGTRWLVFYERSLAAPYETLRVLECPIADLGGMKAVEGLALPKSAEGMAGFQLSFKQQLGDLALAMYEIPVSDGKAGYSLYLFPRQTDPDQITVGRDMKSSFVADAAKPYANTSFHQTVHTFRPRDLQKQLPPGAMDPGWGHNHAASDYPPETDVALAILFPAIRWHILGRNWHFLIGPDGAIQQLPMPGRQNPDPQR
jgi:hypothetical protein